MFVENMPQFMVLYSSIRLSTLPRNSMWMIRSKPAMVGHDSSIGMPFTRKEFMEKPLRLIIASREEWIHTVWPAVKIDFTYEEIWNMDENCLYFMPLSDLTFCLKDENKAGESSSLSISCCYSAVP